MDEVSNAVKNPIKLNRGEVIYSGFVDSSYFPGTASTYMDQLIAHSDWTVGGIPATVIIQHQSWTAVRENNEYATIKFDKDNYLNQIKKKLSGKFDPSSLLDLPKDAAAQMIAQAKSSLQHDLSSLNKQYSGMLGGELSFVSGIKDVFSLDVKSLRQKFLNPSFIRDIADKQLLLSSLQQKINAGFKVDMNQFQSLKDEVGKFKGIQELIRNVESHKAKWESSGLLKKIKESNLLRKDKIAKLLKDPAVLRKMAKQHLSLKGLERFFLNINRMDIGQSALSLSPMSFNNFLNNGALTEFINKGKSILLMSGKQKDFNSIIDYGFNGNLISNNGFVNTARLQLNKSGQGTSHISIASFRQILSSTSIPVNAADFRQVLVTTLSQQLPIGEKGNVSVDLSRSATQYKTSGLATDSTLAAKSQLSGILSGENIMANSALSFRYADELSERGLSYQVNFSKVANGYANPGNTFLSNGSTEAGFQVRKSFLKRKLQVSVRANTKTYKYDENNDNSWRSSYATVDARWKMKKGQYIGIRYQPNSMKRIDQHGSNTLSSIERISLDAGLYKKINRVTYRNLINVSYQKSSYGFMQGFSATSSLTVNSFQNITLGKNLIYVNTTYNNARNQSGYMYLNSSLLAETGCTYQIFRRITASSSITYGSVTDWYRQIGLRQTLSGDLGEKCSINIYFDARHNITVIQPLWNDPVRADIAFKYIFGKNN